MLRLTKTDMVTARRSWRKEPTELISLESKTFGNLNDSMLGISLTNRN